MKSKVHSSGAMKVGEPLVVDWNDSTSGCHEWTRLKDYDMKEHAASAGHQTAGFFIGKQDKILFVAQNYRDVDQMVGHVMAIPLAIITKIQRVKSGKGE